MPHPSASRPHRAVLAPAALLATLALLGATAPVGAWHVPDIPTLDFATFSEERYVAWRVSAPANTLFGVQIDGVEGEVPFASFALWDMPADTLEFSGLINWAWYNEGGAEAHAQVGPLPPLASVDGSSQVQTDYLRMWVDHEKFTAGEWILVAMATFDGELQGTFRLIGAEGVQLLGRTEGPAFLHRERDFQGEVNVVARAELPVREATVEGKVARNLAVETDAAERLFAAFQGSYTFEGTHLDLLRMGYDGPDGAHDGRLDYIVTAGEPGDYRFRIDENLDWHDNTPVCTVLNGAYCWRVPAWVVGADVTLP